MFSFACLTFLASLPPVCANGWDDFSNNLATDLTPFLSLFGEQLTKQFLSESITYYDYFIFAMAPMGILTAIVSAIRVCGSSNLRALIGRAQEGGGVAEAELCSSTSHNVCELYNNGGIARVFGRPKILEIVHDPTAHSDDENKGNIGIYTFQDYMKTDNGKREWGENDEPRDPEPAATAFAPNLSLNIGIKSQPDYVVWAVTVIGFVLQAGVLVFAIVVTYHLHWEKDGRHVASYACPLAIIGTVLVCSGIYLCAFLVGQSTNERIFQRKPTSGTKDRVASTIYWIQPGDQSLGDQIFEPFSWSDHKKHLQKYTISRKKENISENTVIVWVAIGTTITGFVLQFIGLRGLHSAISVAQLGAIMVMSAVRAVLRMERLKPDDNFLANYRDTVIGHELDWLALHIGRDDIKPHNHQPPFSQIVASNSTLTPSLALPQYECFWKFSGVTDANYKVLHELPPSDMKLNAAAKILAYRTRLAQLTESPNSHVKFTNHSSFKVEMVEVRRMAQKLATAIESVINLVFSNKIQIKLKGDWESAENLYWGSACHVSSNLQNKSSPETQNRIYLQLHRKIGSETVPTSSWKLENSSELEALLGLWLWSLKHNQAIENQDKRGNLRELSVSDSLAQRIVGTDQNVEDLKLWHEGNTFHIQKYTLDIKSLGPSRPGSFCNFNEPDRKQNLGSLQHGSKKHRVFGWHAIEQILRQNPNELTIWSTDANISLLLLCSQEIFGTFLASILDITKNVGEIEMKAEGYRFWLKNNLSLEVIDLFVNQGLGSREDALLCIVPPIVSACQRNESFTTNALGAAKKSAIQYRKDGYWEESERILKWALKTCAKANWTNSEITDAIQNNPSSLTRRQDEQGVIALCELYRWALRDPNRRNFGVEGLKMLNEDSNQPKNIKKIIDRYYCIAERSEFGEDIDIKIGQSIYEEDLTAILHCLTWSKSIGNQSKGNILHLAVKNAWAEVILILQEIGVEIDFKDLKQKTALLYAAESGHSECMRDLLDGGAFPNLSDRDHRTPLSYAAAAGFKAVTGILVDDSRVEINATDNDGRTPLSWAADNGHEAVVKLLLETGKVKPDAKDNARRTPLSWAAYNGHEAVAKLLLDTGKVEIDAKDNYGRTPLFLAAYKGHEAVVRLLIDTGKAEIDAKDNDGRTPLAWAASNGHEAVVKLLIDTGKAEIDAKDNGGRTPLLRAANYGREAVAKLLLDTGKVEPDAKDNYGKTPLWISASIGHETMVKLLLDYGANINVHCGEFGTALRAAIYRRHSQIEKLLRENGAEGV